MDFDDKGYPQSIEVLSKVDEFSFEVVLTEEREITTMSLWDLNYAKLEGCDILDVNCVM